MFPEYKPGMVVRHYRGGLYVILALSEHTEVKEECVVYMGLEDNSQVWHRPLSMFTGTVDLEDGSVVARFTPMPIGKEIYIGNGKVMIIRGING
jgi:hypothetical protein